MKTTVVAGFAFVVYSYLGLGLDWHDTTSARRALGVRRRGNTGGPELDRLSTPPRHRRIGWLHESQVGGGPRGAARELGGSRQAQSSRRRDAGRRRTAWEGGQRCAVRGAGGVHPHHLISSSATECGSVSTTGQVYKSCENIILTLTTCSTFMSTTKIKSYNIPNLNF